MISLVPQKTPLTGTDITNIASSDRTDRKWSNFGDIGRSKKEFNFKHFNMQSVYKVSKIKQCKHPQHLPTQSKKKMLPL